MTRRKDALAAAANAVKSAAAEIDGIRAEITALKAQRAEVEAAPLPDHEVSAGIDSLLDTLARSAPYHGPDAVMDAVAKGGTPMIELHGATTLGTVTALLVPLLRTHLRDALMAHLRQYYEAHPPGLPAAERQQRIAEIDQQLLEMETQEVELVRFAANAGIAIEYRPDTSPAAILGV
ncbi:hypothetical protein [Defluviicoccus vanus]|uniref:Uncharacterized protein n=1 Tax=Defluviicoccus vanus TaxID=111831 RepID=A0A7H1N0P1_9PROT|nr:hypothetical protein [Defluviicoccus vanus]QNT69277.1 hypothetical protein HQ394_08005 [Defluviicoccus vanus]